MSLETELSTLNTRLVGLTYALEKHTAALSNTKKEEEHRKEISTVSKEKSEEIIEADKPTPKKRKRRTKAEMERDKVIAKCANVSTPKEDKPTKGTTWTSPSLK